MGTVTPYQTAAGKRYRVRYRTPDHKQTDKRGFKTKREADLFLASVEVDKATGTFIDATAARATIGSLAQAWLRGRETLKPSSFRVLELTWRLHVGPVWASKRLSEVRHSAVQDWVAELSQRRSATVVLRAYGILAGILDVAVKDRLIPRNSARGVALPRKGGKAHIYLTHEQVESLAAEAGDHATLVRFLAYTGLRWGEAVGLRVSGLDLLRRRVAVDENAVNVGGKIVVGTPKTHKRRSVPFPAFLTLELAQHS